MRIEASVIQYFFYVLLRVMWHFLLVILSKNLSYLNPLKIAFSQFEGYDFFYWSTGKLHRTANSLLNKMLQLRKIALCFLWKNYEAF